MPKRNYLALVIISHVFFGYSLSQGWGIATLISLGCIYVLIGLIAKFTYKSYSFMVFVSQAAMMFGAVWWFRNIDALGWGLIAGISPSYWLMGLMFIISVIVAVFTSAILLPLKFLFNKYKNPWVHMYSWSAAMTIVELIRSITFSVITKSDGMPIEPTWNLFAIAPLSSTLEMSWIGRVYGFWGTSFVLYVLAACLASGLIMALHRKWRATFLALTPAAILLVIGIAGSKIYLNNTQQSSVTGIAVSDNQEQNQYLSSLKNELQPGSDTTVVVLPEYSNLISPSGNSSFLSFNTDVQADYIDTYGESETYFIGTEDIRKNGKRHAETYLVNGRLETLATKGKTFLIPGGEYTPPWIKNLLSLVDKQTVYKFVQNSERTAYKNSSNTEANPLGNKVAFGACSVILQPYVYRNEVAKGATVLTSNISFEQFIHAPEYTEYVDRFAKFTTTSLRRPLVTGVRGGNAKIYDENGKVAAQTTNQRVTAEKILTTSDGKTIYALVGDLWIMSLLLLPFLFITTMQLKYLRKQRLTRLLTRCLRTISQLNKK